MCDYARSMDIPLLDFKGIINQHSYVKRDPLTNLKKYGMINIQRCFYE
ncbi:MAG TPA: hypothetical protein DHV15_05425 [Treponema sp.]|uniref:Uncharacterized protein n=1 Tax=Treponema denticola (strain ATCC 35405 / DSM 14222 / CIP 103919 / JCM 8153 / KCTC 15104) TaxID=243275 RepID=Q73M92_TREDE|nr:hypothetical protein TDE_1617 [Treponema denticola ATCC 35405]HCY94942.1 hypothetical protein [Treponema sp.]